MLCSGQPKSSKPFLSCCQKTCFEQFQLSNFLLWVNHNISQYFTNLQCPEFARPIRFSLVISLKLLSVSWDSAPPCCFVIGFYFSIKITAYTSENGLPVQNPTVVWLQSYNTSCQITVTFMIKWPVEMFQWPPAGIVSHVTWKNCIVAIATPFSLDVHGFVENIGFGPIPTDIVNVGIFPHECFLP